MRTPKNRYIRILPLLALCLFFLSGCAAARHKTPVTELSQLNDASRTIGVAADTTEGELVEEMFPQAKIKYFSDDVSAYLSVQQGKLDAFVYDKYLMEVAVRGGVTGVTILEDTLGDGNTSAVAISPKTKIPGLEEKIDTFLNEISAGGTMEDIAFRWLEERSEVMPDIPLPETSDLHLKVGTTGTSTPFSFYAGPDLVGYDIELAMRFAAWLGATIEFKTYDYSGLVPAALSGDVDCIFANLFVTPEREEALRFSGQTYAGPVGVMIRDPAAPLPEFTEFVELSGKTVSMLTGAPFEDLVKSKEPGVAQFTFFNNNPDMVLALQSGKTDAILQNNAIATLAANRNEGICLFPQTLDTSEFGIAFAKEDARVWDWQQACESISKETKEALWEKWTGADETAKVLPEQDWPGTNGVIQAAVCDSLEPMSYLDGSGNALGFDIEMILLMAKELDVHVQFTGMEFSAILPYVQSGKADIGAGSIIITQERLEAADFVSYYPASFVLMVRTVDDTSPEDGLLTSLRDGFEKTFLRENRYLQFLEGIGMTLLITLLSALFGTAFGFLLFLACRRGNRYAVFLTGIFEKLMSGMPMIVLLMILYYVIFGRIAVSGALVSVLAFTMVFGAEIFSLMTTAVGAVSAGQTEAALALGYPDRKAFFKHILPQALPFFMPGYRSGLVNLIKSTSIVGYIAVQDLTKIGDLVRSRTYEAFFPLIATAVIYFVLAWLLVMAVDAVTRRIDPARRKTEDILKGIRTSAPSGD